MRILVACEESQSVTTHLRVRGHDAWSCDLQPCSGTMPEYHLQQDVVPLLRQRWDMIIAFPPCTDLASSGARWFAQKRADGRQQASIDFFMLFANADCERIAIENPVGIMSGLWRKPDQIIQPWQFGHPQSKLTCLWLKNLPLLVPTDIVPLEERAARNVYKSGKSMDAWFASLWRLPKEERSRMRSKTFDGIARAMASQWG